MWMWLLKEQATPAALARKLNYSSATVVRWLYGDRVPDRIGSGIIFQELEIEPSKFDAKPVRGFTPPAARAA